MATPPLPHHLAIEAARLYREYRGNVSAAARAAGIPRPTLQKRVATARARGLLSHWLSSGVKPRVRVQAVSSRVGGDLADLLMSALRRPGGYTVEELAAQHAAPEATIVAALERLRVDRAVNLVTTPGGRLHISATPPPREPDHLVEYELISDEDGRHVLGVCSDQHIGSRYHRPDVLAETYDQFAQLGITTVLNAGNWIEGEDPRKNLHDVSVHGLDGQIRALVEQYPQRPGMRTLAVWGDDHEGWYAQREGVDMGAYAERAMRSAGRHDWFNAGFMEADFRLIDRRTGLWRKLRLSHPGGGSSYALSYRPQKIVESLDGGDKPAVLIMGHYHKLGVWNSRNVWLILIGSAQEQSTFLRKKAVEAHISRAVVTLEHDVNTGAIVECCGLRRWFADTRDWTGSGRWSYTSDPRRVPLRPSAGA